MSRVYLMVFIGIALFAIQISAHGRMSQPTPRYEPFYSANDPVHFPLGKDFICKNNAPENSLTTLTAGQTTNFTWMHSANHPGDCFAYLSYDTNVPDEQMKWFKIAQFRDCNQMNGVAQNIMIPSYLPACDHCVFRWEWYAIHVQAVGIVEYYTQCADVKIIGSSSGSLPTPQVTIPGHLPMDALKYRNPDGADRYTGLLIGPPLATIGGTPYNCTEVYGSSCNVAPPPRGCPLSMQRCVNSTAYQGCGIGINKTEWKDPQACPVGLVCVDGPSGDRIYCDRPQSSSTPVVNTPTPVPVTPTPTPTPTPVIPTPTPVTPSGTSAILVAATSAAPSVASNTGEIQPSTPSYSSSSSSSSSGSSIPSTCTQGNMKCTSSETYSTCDRGLWGPSQSCQIGLTCTPSGAYIYCT